jgi:hypothetical protein
LLIVGLPNMSKICHWLQTFWGLLAEMLHYLHNYPTHQEVGRSCLFSRNGSSSWYIHDLPHFPTWSSSSFPPWVMIIGMRLEY